jgi:hypothetical protein
MRRVTEDPSIADAAYSAKVIRAFIKGDRLVSVPARERKKQVVLRHIVRRVLPDDAAIDEPEMNRRLAAWHPDVAALRRYLVESGLATRTGMTYRRARPPSDAAAAEPESRGVRDEPEPPDAPE